MTYGVSDHSSSQHRRDDVVKGIPVTLFRVAHSLRTGAHSVGGLASHAFDGGCTCSSNKVAVHIHNWRYELQQNTRGFRSGA
jgi:hypothetical protein